MVYKRFRVVVLARIFILFTTLSLFLYLLLVAQTRLYATMFILGLVIVYQIYGLIYYVEKTNRDLHRFLQTIKYEDFSQTFARPGLGSSFDDLKNAFNDIIRKFQKARADKEEHFRYLQTVVQHVGIGLLAFRQDGKVELLNTAAKRLLQIPALKQISDLKRISAELMNTLTHLKSSETALVKIQQNNELLQLAISATEFRMRNQNFTLVSLQNIQSELEEQELDAWQKLIRVLTHEIMNSVTPISSLAATLNELVANKGDTLLETENREDLLSGLQTIRKRSEGLLHFVEAYRGLTRVPTPKFKLLRLRDLLSRVVQLMQPEFKASNVTCSLDVVPDTLELMADPELVEQIVINMVKNALQAVDGQPEARIDLAAKIDTRGRVIIQIADNGPGISEELQDKIFIPFFTTKENGSGIGLSLSRQIMRLHDGSISVQSNPEDGTVFTLRF